MTSHGEFFLYGISKFCADSREYAVYEAKQRQYMYGIFLFFLINNICKVFGFR